MLISEIIAHLEKIKAEHGDIQCCVSEPHEYWGSIENRIEEWNTTVSEHAQPEGPKSGKCEKAVIFNS